MIEANNPNKNWEEDKKQYLGKCFKCKEFFLGKKSRFICKECKQIEINMNSKT